MKLQFFCLKCNKDRDYAVCKWCGRRTKISNPGIVEIQEQIQGVHDTIQSIKEVKEKGKRYGN